MSTDLGLVGATILNLKHTLQCPLFWEGRENRRIDMGEGRMLKCQSLRVWQNGVRVRIRVRVRVRIRVNLMCSQAVKYRTHPR